jgi:hypothetical protein
MKNLDTQTAEIDGKAGSRRSQGAQGGEPGQYDRPAPDLTAPRTGEPGSPAELARNSWLYREFQAQREEILKYKWIESEKAGHDIGFERALTGWIKKEHKKWRQSRPARSASSTSSPETAGRKP